jgi:hypothetical protein
MHDATYDEKLSGRVEYERVIREARRVIDNESWMPPDPGRSLTESRSDPPDPVRFVIDSFLPEGISVMAAQFKAGKTTLGIDLSACLVECHDFLDYFEVDEIAGNVGYWNLEVDEPQMFEWQNRRIDRGASRVFTAHLRGKRMDILQPHIAEWTVRWLTGFDVDVWLIDPLGRMLDEENDPATFSRWFRQLEAIVTEANVRSTLIMHHSGHAAAGEIDPMPRARGASSILGNSDANIGYRHGGEMGAIPPDSRRYISAYGRGVSLWPELTLDYEYSSGRLFVVDDAPGRDYDQMEHGIEQVISAIEEAGPWILNTTALKDFVDGQSGYKAKVVSYAVRAGKIMFKPTGRGGKVFATPEQLGPS